MQIDLVSQHTFEKANDLFAGSSYFFSFFYFAR